MERMPSRFNNQEDLYQRLIFHSGLDCSDCYVTLRLLRLLNGTHPHVAYPTKARTPPHAISQHIKTRYRIRQAARKLVYHLGA